MESTPWKHPSLSMEDLIRHIGAFLDILLLASGYQSTGARASWSIETVERAFNWAFFLEKAMEQLVDEDSRQALDKALTSLMDSIPHPPGLPSLSATVLMEARVLLSRVLIQAMGNDNRQIASVLVAAVKIDASSAQGPKEWFVREQTLDEQVLKVDSSCHGTRETPTNCSSHLDGRMVGNRDKCREAGKQESRSSKSCGDLWSFSHREILRRCSATGHVNCLARAVDAAAEVDSLQDGISPAVTLWRNEEYMEENVRKKTISNRSQLFSDLQLEQWRQRGLSYLMSAKTLYKLSGALILFNGSKLQWTQVFDAITTEGVKAEEGDCCVTEIAELCCMYLGYKRWIGTCLKLLASSNSSPPCQNMCSKLGELSSLLHAEKEVEIESYLVQLATEKHDVWWTLPPVLLAVAVPASSRLLNLYVESLLSHATHASARCPHHLSISGPQSCTAAMSERTWNLLFCQEGHGDASMLPTENLESLLSHLGTSQPIN